MAVACLLLAGCTDDPARPEPPLPTARSPLPPLEPRPSPSASGAVEIIEIGFSVLEERETGSAIVAWAATVANTSNTDVLAYADFALTWRSADGETEVFESKPSPLQRIHDVPPGRTGVIGGAGDFVGFVPASLDVVPDNVEWYPMRDLEAHGLAIGAEVTEFRLDVESTVRVQAALTSPYEHEGGEFHLLVVARDEDGTLLGAVIAEPYPVPTTPPGPRELDARVRLSQWPEAADPSTSEVAVVKVCCTFAY